VDSDTDVCVGARRGPKPGLVVFVAAVLANVWALRLEFAKDDYSVVGSAPFFIGATREAPRPDFERPSALERLTPEAEKEARGALAEENYLCRPLAAAWWAGLGAVGGGRARPIVFHGASVLMHAFVAWMLFRLLRRFTGAEGALIGAAWFAVHPAAHQAFTWIAAAGDLLSAACALGGLLILLEGSERAGAAGWMRDLAGATLLAAAVAAKESAAVLLPIAAVVYLVATRPRLGRVIRIAVFGVLALGLVFTWRYAFLGRFFPTYPTTRPLDERVLALFPALLGQMVAPFNRAAAFVATRPVVVRIAEAWVGSAGPSAVTERARWIAAAAFAPFAVGLVVGGPRLWIRALGVAAAATLALLPAAWMIFTDDGTFTLSRNVYHGAAALAALVALGVVGLRRILPRATIASAIPAALLAVDALVHVARVEVAAAADIRSRLDGVRAVAESQPVDTRLVVMDPDDDVPEAGVAMISNGYPWAFSRTFTDRPIPVERWYRPDAERLAELARDEPRRVVFLRRDASRWTFEGRPLPAVDVDDGVEFAAVPGRPGVYALSRPMATRAIAGLRLRGRQTGGELRITWRTVGASLDTAALDVIRGIYVAGDNGIVGTAPEDEEYWRDRILKEVEVSGVDLFVAPHVMRSIPEIELLGAVPSGLLPAGELPELAFRNPRAVSGYRIAFRFQLTGFEPTITYSIDALRPTRGPDGVLRWKPNSQDHAFADEIFAGSGRFERLAELWASAAKPLGLQRILVRYRIEGVGADAVLCRSPWGLFALTGPEHRGS
jgi:hypothetical protein